jgi:predicted transcriptional regulator
MVASLNGDGLDGWEQVMKKLKHEAELVAHALRVGAVYAKKRGVAEFEASDSAKDKITYLYRLLAHDKLIQPLAKGQENEPNMKHKLALWMSRQLPEDHALLQ